MTGAGSWAQGPLGGSVDGVRPPALAWHVDVGRSLPDPPPGNPVLLSLEGPPVPAGRGHVLRSGHGGLHGGRLVGFGFEWPVPLGRSADSLVAVDFTRRSGEVRDFDASFVECQRTAAGTARVFAAASASGRTTLRSSTVWASWRFVMPAGVPGSARPWASVGIGLGHVEVQAFTAQLGARLSVRSAGYAIDDRLTGGQQLVSQRGFDNLAWQGSAGLDWPLGEGRALRAGLRYARLGRYRLIGETSEWRVDAQGEVLRAVFASESSRLVAREWVMSWVQRF